MYIFLFIVVLSYIVKIISSLAVFPGQWFAKTETIDESQLDKTLAISFFQEKTQRNRIIDAVKISNPESDKTVIIFNGQSATIKNNKKIQTYYQLAKDSGCTVIGFDYGGTGLKRISTWSYQSLVDDGLHLVKRVFNNGENKGPIILKGNSLGGAVSTSVTKLCHDQSMPVYLGGNGRSFRSVSAVLAGYIQTLRLSGHYENFLTKNLALLIEPFASVVLQLTQFERNIKKDYEAIPDAYKYYYIVRSTKEERAYKKDDVIIPYPATLESEPDIKQSIKKSLTVQEFSPEDIQYYWKHRKVTSLSPDNAHATPENVLFCRHNPMLSAYDLFCIFAKQYVRSESTPLTQNETFDRIRL